MKSVVSFDDFAKLDPRVGTIIDCVEKEGSERLLKLSVDFEEEGILTIFSGIKQWYKPEDYNKSIYLFTRGNSVIV